MAEELDDKLKSAGEQAVFDAGVHNVHPEIVRLLGRLKFRSSYSQNVYQHSLEVAFISGIIAGRAQTKRSRGEARRTAA